MFWTKKKPQSGTVTLAVEEDIPPIPVTVDPQVFDGIDTYNEIATDIGFSNQAINEINWTKKLQDNGFSIYPTDKVGEYLTKRARKENSDWSWFPLREQDIKFKYAIQPPVVVKFYDPWVNSYCGYVRNDQQYQQAVPLPILMTVQKVSKLFESCHFYVAALHDPISDPFLAVTGTNVPFFVIERWDEPSFRG